MAEEGYKIYLGPAILLLLLLLHPPTFGNMDWGSGISQQTLIGSSSNFKLKLR
jgi:hypothetical protein